MHDDLKALRSLFESGTAEGDEAFLADVFVTFEDYLDVVSAPKAGPRIVLGNKGSGKSAALRYFKSQITEIGIPSIFLRPKDIELPETDESALGPLTRNSEHAILTAIAAHIGSNLSGLVVGENSENLLTVAQAQGTKTKDFVQKALALLAPIGQAVASVDFSKLSRKDDISIAAMRRSIESSLSGAEKLFYVLIDDTDQVASPTERNQLNRIWGFLLASRSINESCPNIKFLISMRDEVWRRLKRDDAGQRDQIDHFRGLAKRISMSESNLKEIVKRRLIRAHPNASQRTSQSPYALFFDTTHVCIPTAEEEYRYWDDFIAKRARGRPRDSIQLIYKFCDHAITHRQDRITTTDVEAVMPVYSEERVDDLKRECDQECPQIKEIVRAFHDVDFDAGAFSLNPQTTADFLDSLPSRFGVQLFGKSLAHNNPDDVFLLWRYLHEIGFLNARVSDTRESKGFRHITSAEDPDLVSQSRWNEMQAIVWEIHPAYRDYLIKITKEKEFSFGRPKKPTRRRR